nr:hypothetical protein CFP56_25495 [Quercus suber]
MDEVECMLMRWNACSSVRGIGFNGYTKFPLPLTPLNLSSTTSCGHALTRRWTTRARFGNMEPEYPSQYHPSPATFNPEPIIPPVTTTNQSTLISHTPQTAPTQQDIEHATLNSTILSLSLNRGSVPPTPANSPRSSFDFPYLPNPNHNTYMWVNGARPFMTNKELKEVTEYSSATESDSETIVMFNLDRLNDDRPVWLRGAARERVQILESTKGLIDPLVNRVDRDRLWAKFGGLGNTCGPSRKRIRNELRRLRRNIRQKLIYGFFPKEASGKGQEVWQKCGFSEGWEVPRVGFSGGHILAWLPRQGL